MKMFTRSNAFFPSQNSVIARPVNVAFSRFRPKPYKIYHPYFLPVNPAIRNTAVTYALTLIRLPPINMGMWPPVNMGPVNTVTAVIWAPHRFYQSVNMATLIVYIRSHSCHEHPCLRPLLKALMALADPRP